MVSLWVTPPSDPGGQEGKSTLCQGSLGLHSAWPRHCPLLSVPCASLWAGIQAWGYPAQSQFLLCLNPEMHPHPGLPNPYSADSASPPLEALARGVSEGPAVDDMPCEASEDSGGCEVAKAAAASRRRAPALTGHGVGPGGWCRGWHCPGILRGTGGLPAIWVAVLRQSRWVPPSVSGGDTCCVPGVPRSSRCF